MSSLDQLAGVAPPPTIHRVKSVGCIPYDARRDSDADKFLPYVWNRLKDEGLVTLYFPGEESFGFSSFVQLFSGGAEVILLVERKEDGTLDRMIGFCTWTSLPFGAAKAAIAGFIFFREFWDGESSKVAAQQAMHYWFDEAGLDITLGLVAEDNHLARRFLQRVGWTKLGAVPYLGLYNGKSCDGSFWYNTREQYHMRSSTNGHA